MEVDAGTKAVVEKCLHYLKDFYWDFSTWRERIPHAFLAEQSSPPRYRSGSVGALENTRANLASACVYLRTAGYDRDADNLERLFGECLADIKRLNEWFDDPKRIREQGEKHYPHWARELTQENAWYYSDVEQRHDDELEHVLSVVLDALCDRFGLTITFDDAESPAFPWRLAIAHSTFADADHDWWQVFRQIALLLWPDLRGLSVDDDAGFRSESRKRWKDHTGGSPPYREAEWRALWFKLLPGEQASPAAITDDWIMRHLTPVLVAKWESLSEFKIMTKAEAATLFDTDLRTLKKRGIVTDIPGHTAGSKQCRARRDAIQRVESCT